MFQECRKARLSLWQCPPFLFLVMGAVTITAMIGTYVLASSRADEPQIAALIVAGVAAFIFIIGNIIISSFNRVVEANKMKAEFVYVVSHQLRSPLAILKWTLDTIDNRLKHTPFYASLENSLYTLRNTNEYLIRLANSLLEVNRIEARTFVLRTENFSLEILTREIVNGFKRYAEASNKEIKTEPLADLPATTGDKDRTALVIQNLIDNAIRYTPGAGDIIIKIGRTDGFLKWEIKDEGMGIPPEKQKYMFQKFFRAEEAITAQPHGSGIGLYISKSIIEASGGRIGFSSDPKRGSTFWFTLPLACN